MCRNLKKEKKKEADKENSSTSSSLSNDFEKMLLNAENIEKKRINRQKREELEMKRGLY